MVGVYTFYRFAVHQRVVICLNYHHGRVWKTNRFGLFITRKWGDGRLSAWDGLPLLSTAFQPPSI